MTELEESGRGATPVPPRGGKGKGGAKRPAPNRPAPKNGKNAKGRQARQAAERRNRWYLILGVVVAVGAILAVVFTVSGGKSGPPRQAVPPNEVAQMENIPVSTLVAAKAGLNPAQAAMGVPPDKVGGKPTVLFIGAEFCPICAAERWPMTLALMKFGTFTNLQKTHSAVVDGNAGTWSYEGATYTSQYLNFQPYELYTNQPSGGYYKKLDTLPDAAHQIWANNLGSQLTFPFVDFAGQEVIATAQYNPSSLYNHSFENVLGAVGSNDNTTGAAIDAAAAVFVKYLCGVTQNQPSDVCSAVASVSAPVTQGSSNGGGSTPTGH